MKFIAGTCAAIAISAMGMLAHAQVPKPTPQAVPPPPVRPATQGTERVAPPQPAQATDPSDDVIATGCVRAWAPASEDVTKHPDNREPGVAGTYLLTPVLSGPNSSMDLPTYLLTPTQTVNFAAHLDDKVEVVGVRLTAPMPPTAQEIATAPPRPENKPTTTSMPRLTVRSLKKVSDSCP